MQGQESMHEKKFHIVLVATSDLKHECGLAASVIEELNRNTAGSRGVRLELYWWYTDVHEQFQAETAQSAPEVIPGLRDCDLVIGVFREGFTLAASVGVTAPEREISSAYAAWKRQRKPEVFVYFRNPNGAIAAPE